jgi:hypothetical protein
MTTWLRAGRVIDGAGFADTTSRSDLRDPRPPHRSRPVARLTGESSVHLAGILGSTALIDSWQRRHPVVKDAMRADPTAALMRRPPQGRPEVVG